MRNISQLHPEAQKKALKLQQECLKVGIKIKIGECFRTVDEQDALYAIGRKAGGSIVTNAKGNIISIQLEVTLKEYVGNIPEEKNKQKGFKKKA